MCDLAPEDIVQVEGRQHFWHEGRHIGLVAASQLLNRPAPQNSSQTLKVVVIRERETIYGVAVERFIGERTLVVLPWTNAWARSRTFLPGPCSTMAQWC